MLCSLRLLVGTLSAYKCGNERWTRKKIEALSEYMVLERMKKETIVKSHLQIRLNIKVHELCEKIQRYMKACYGTGL